MARATLGTCVAAQIHDHADAAAAIRAVMEFAAGQAYETDGVAIARRARVWAVELLVTARADNADGCQRCGRALPTPPDEQP